MSLSSSRVVSTQMFPQLTMKVMVHEKETYVKVTPLAQGLPRTWSTSSLDSVSSRRRRAVKAAALVCWLVSAPPPSS